MHRKSDFGRVWGAREGLREDDRGSRAQRKRSSEFEDGRIIKGKK